MNVNIFDNTNWKLLSKQKETLLHLFFSDRLSKKEKEHIDSLIEFIDDFQDEAETFSYPVVFLEEETFKSL